MNAIDSFGRTPPPVLASRPGTVGDFGPTPAEVRGIAVAGALGYSAAGAIVGMGAAILVGEAKNKKPRLGMGAAIGAGLGAAVVGIPYAIWELTSK